MSNTRRFELLKDFNSGSKAGSIYSLNGDDDKYYYRTDFGSRCDAVIVENSPLLFKEIKDTEESSKPFEWNDNTVDNFIQWSGFSGHSDIRFQIQRYKLYMEKQSKQQAANDVLNYGEEIKNVSQPSQQSKRIEVIDFFFECHERNGEMSYVLQTSDSISNEKYSAIKQAIENVLNDNVLYKFSYKYKCRDNGEEIIYTERELLDAEEKSFKDGQKVKYMFLSFSEYKSIKNQNKNT